MLIPAENTEELTYLFKIFHKKNEIPADRVKYFFATRVLDYSRVPNKRYLNTSENRNIQFGWAILGPFLAKKQEKDIFGPKRVV